MGHKEYVSRMADTQYILHFPGKSLERTQHLLDYNLDRTFSITGHISIISIMDKKCMNNSPIKKQCDFNHIKFYNSAEREYDWSNPKKIGYVLECLNSIDTEYALIVDGRDVCITHDLDKKFLKKVRSFDKPIIYNGTPAAYPKVAVEPIQEILQIKGKQKYLNAGVCVGTATALKEFYQVCQGIADKRPDEISEQLIVRLARQERKDLVAIDHNNELFRIIHHYDTRIVETPSKFVIY